MRKGHVEGRVGWGWWYLYKNEINRIKMVPVEVPVVPVLWDGKFKSNQGVERMREEPIRPQGSTSTPRGSRGGLEGV
eukprot:61820-Prorocentrum_minimum.AAC.1